VADDVYRRAARIVRGTHAHAPEAPEVAKRLVRLGASPRAAQALILGGKVNALLAGRFNVAYADLERVAFPALRHRILVTLEAESEGIDADTVVRAVLDHVQATG
jgi:MoxR-like ATPase